MAEKDGIQQEMNDLVIKDEINENETEKYNQEAKNSGINEDISLPNDAGSSIIQEGDNPHIQDENKPNIVIPNETNEEQKLEEQKTPEPEKPNFVIPKIAKEVFELQRKLHNLCSLTIDSVVYFIMNNFNNEEKYECLAQTINLYSTKRFKLQGEYTELCMRLVTSLKDFSDVLLRETHGTLLRRLFDQGLFTKEQILSKCEQRESQYMYFADKFRIPQKAARSKSLKNMMYCLNDMSYNDWMPYLDYIYFGFKRSSVQASIETNKMEFLYKYTLHPRFNIEQRYSDSPFCPFTEYSEFFFNDRPKYTLLAIAAFFGNTQFFKYLISNGAAITNEVCKCAVRGGNLEIVKMCLERGGNFEGCQTIAIAAHQNEVYDYLNSRLPRVPLSLLSIAKNGNILAAFMYIEQKGDLTATLENGFNPLYEATKSGNESMVKILVENGADPNAINEEERQPLTAAVIRGSVILTKYFVDKGNDVNRADANRWTPLHFAAKNFNMELAEFLIKKGADINALTLSGYSVLHIAIINNNTKLIPYLLERGANPNTHPKDDKSPICLSIVKHKKEITKLLIEHGAEVNTEFDQESPIYLARKENDQELIQLLLENGAKDIPESREDGTLEIKEIESLTLPPSYDIRRKDVYGRSYLLLACQTGQMDIVRKLLSEYADINDKDCNGFTPLITALKYQHEEIAKLLISRGANLNAKAKNGLAALHLAVQNNYIGIVKLMRERGVFMNPSCSLGTPLAMAKTKEMKHLIESYGGV